MIQILNHGVYLIKGHTVVFQKEDGMLCDADSRPLDNDQSMAITEKIEETIPSRNTISFRILTEHNISDSGEKLKIRFDSLASHDITYVGIIQTAKASGLERFPVPYALTNCHNSLCAVGGTINEDDHVFGLSAAQKYGGIYVPAHQAVIHQYVRETMAGCGKMIMGSDSHTRYGALGTMGVGEGGPELVKQLLGKTYDLSYPEIIGVYLQGKPRPGVGPQDVALAIIGAVFKNGFVTNKVLEFIGPGINNLSVDYRNGIDVMTTETTCLSSIWKTDDKVRGYFEIHGRPEAYAKLEPGEVAYYDGMIKVDLDKIVPMIALPFHPSNAYPISVLNENAQDILRLVEEEGKQQLGQNIDFQLTDKIVNGRLQVDQAIVAGCAGGSFENMMDVARIIDQHSVGNDYLALSVYPASQPIYLELVKNGAAAKLMGVGAVIKTAFCGPCFGAGDVPSHGGLSIRHTTRNFPNREGSRPGEGQISSVALMDARSIAATSMNGGRLTPATEIEYDSSPVPFEFDQGIYANRVYNGFERPQKDKELRFGPNIADWPEMIALPDNLILQMAAVIMDPVTTTDELIPSGETSSYRSNPLKLAEFTLSRKEPQYVPRTKKVQSLEIERRELLQDKEGDAAISADLNDLCQKIMGLDLKEYSGETFVHQKDLLRVTGIGSVIYAVKPGDGSAREQAASSQKVLGGWANIAREYATKRYRSNLINWGMLPFTVGKEADFKVDDIIYISGIRKIVAEGGESIPALVISASGVKEINLELKKLSQDERDIILRGSLINYYTIS